MSDRRIVSLPAAAMGCVMIAFVTALLLAAPSAAQSVNYNPSFNPGPDVTVPMNGGTTSIQWATNISDNDGGSQGLAFVVTPDNTQLFSGNVLITSAGRLSFTPASNRIGSTSVTVYLQDDGVTSCLPCGCSPANCQRSISYTFLIIITAINQCPSWRTTTTTISVMENSVGIIRTSFATNVIPGTPAHESSQQLFWDVVVSDTTLFSAQPTMAYTPGSSTADLRFEPAPNFNGQASVYVTLRDDGGITGGGCDRATTQTITIRVIAVNSAPSFSFGESPIEVREGYGAYSLGGWATLITAGTNEDTEQTVTFNLELVDSSHRSIFRTQPSIDSSGRLFFEAFPTKNTLNQVVEARVQLVDSLNEESCTLSACPRLRIIIQELNQKPSFNAGPDITVWEDRKDRGQGAPLTFNWATDITPGNNDEVAEGQTVRFVVTSSNSDLFSVAPSISPTGVLSFTLNQYQNGASQVSVTIWDSEGENQIGNTADFALNVLPSNNAPIFSFVPGQPLSVLQNSGDHSIGAFIRGLAPGPEDAPDEDEQNVWMTSAGRPSTCFSNEPTLTTTSSTTAKIGWTLADNICGTCFVDVTAYDDGGTVRNGANQRTQSFQVDIQHVNAPPTFNLSPTKISQTENEYPQGRTVTGLVSNVVSGPFEDLACAGSQTVSLSLVATNPQLFSAQPSISAQGDLTFTAMLDAYGFSEITITATDTGSPPLSTSKVVHLIIEPVNHEPTFDVGEELSNATLSECRSLPSCAYTYTAWARGMSVGPANENTQSFHFIVDTGTAADLFGTPPAIEAATGTLSFTLAPYVNTAASGPRSMLITMVDDGGTNFGGDDRFQRTIFISIAPYQGEPSARLGNSLQLRRNGVAVTVPQFLTTIDPGYQQHTAHNLNYTVTMDEPAAFASGPTVTTTGDSIASITATPAQHAFGTKTGRVRLFNPVTQKSTLIEFSVNIVFVNEAPSFTLVSELTLVQGQQNVAVQVASNMSVGAGEAGTQQFSFRISCSASDGRQLFSSGPLVDQNGMFRCSLLGLASGTADCSVTMRDTGGTADGGSDSSPTQRFTLTVVTVNHAPTFVARTTRIDVLQNSGAFTLSQWATAVSPGTGDESSGQVVTFQAACCPTASSFFAVRPTVDAATGVLAFTPSTNVAGTCSCDVTLVDNGPSAPPNVNTSAAVTVAITVIAVNQPPTIAVANRSLSVVSRNDAYTFASFVSGVTPGPESSQTVQILPNVVSGSHLFAAAPAVTANGELSFATNPTASGVASVAVCAIDSGGTLNGGRDRTCLTVSISMIPASLTPSFGVSNVTVFHLQRAGVVTFASFVRDISAQSGSNLVQTAVTFIGQNATSCRDGFSVQPFVDPSAGDLRFAASDSFFGRCLGNLSITDGSNGLASYRLIEFVILQVNLAPSFSPGPANVSAPFSAGRTVVPWATRITAGDAAESATQTLFGSAMVLTAGVLVGDRATFDPLTGDISFNVTANEPSVVHIRVQLTDNAGTANGGADTSASQDVWVTVLGVNTAPSFVTPATLTLLQGAAVRTIGSFATSIVPGTAPWEIVQQLSFDVVVNDTTGFAQFPTIAADTGTLTMAFFATFRGTVSIVMQLRDNGGTLYGGADRSLTRDLLLTISGVNSAPSFTVSRSTMYVIQGVAYVENQFIRDLSAGPGEGHQAVGVQIAADVSFTQPLDSAFSALSFSGPNLTITPQRFFTGSVRLQLRAVDDGGVSNGGQNSFVVSVMIVVLQRNAPPTMSVRALTAEASAGVQTFPGFVTNVSAVEANQTVQLSVSAADPTLFSTMPSVTALGVLTFALHPRNTSVLTGLTVRAVDTGGTANGGQDTMTRTVALTVAAPPPSPSFEQLLTSVTVSTAATATFAVLSNVVSNTASNTVQLATTRADATLIPLLPEVTSDGVVSFATGGATGSTSIGITVTNAEGGAASASVAVQIVVPSRMRVWLAGDVASFNADAFRAQMAVVFSVQPSQIVITSVVDGSVIVTFYVSGRQAALSPQLFVSRANNPNDPIQATIPIVLADLVNTTGTTPTTTTSAAPGTPPPGGIPTPGPADASSNDDSILGLSTTVWLIVFAVVVVLAILICIICVVCIRKRDSAHDDVEDEKSPAKKNTEAKKERGKGAAYDVDDDDNLAAKPQHGRRKRRDAAELSSRKDGKGRSAKHHELYSPAPRQFIYEVAEDEAAQLPVKSSAAAGTGTRKGSPPRPARNDVYGQHPPTAARGRQPVDDVAVDIEPWYDDEEVFVDVSPRHADDGGDTRPRANPVYDSYSWAQPQHRSAGRPSWVRR